jgi:hypothetical protein
MASTNNKPAPGSFPGPYINRAEKDTSVMHYVPTDDMDIGARPSGLPTQAQVKRGSMEIKHVQDQNRK